MLWQVTYVRACVRAFVCVVGANNWFTENGPYQSLVEFPLGQEVCFLCFLFSSVCGGGEGLP